MGDLTSRFLSWNKAVLRPTKWSFGIALLLCAPLTLAQNNLGELLDAGAKKLSAEEFRDEVVQRVIVGPTPRGGNIEVIYATTGAIQGVGNYRDAASLVVLTISGEWRIDDDGRICTGMQIGTGTTTNLAGPVMLPPRCQIWFKYQQQYFLSDSDSDRSARVFRRTFKQ